MLMGCSRTLKTPNSPPLGAAVPMGAESRGTGGRVPRSREISGGRPPRNLDISVTFCLTRIKKLYYPTFSK